MIKNNNWENNFSLVRINELVFKLNNYINIIICYYYYYLLLLLLFVINIIINVVFNVDFFNFFILRKKLKSYLLKAIYFKLKSYKIIIILFHKTTSYIL